VPSGSHHSPELAHPLARFVHAAAEMPPRQPARLAGEKAVTEAVSVSTRGTETIQQNKDPATAVIVLESEARQEARQVFPCPHAGCGKTFTRVSVAG